MTTRARVIALGQAAAGDDGVGFAILEEIRRRGVPAGVELTSAPDPTALLERNLGPSPLSPTGRA